ncbi:MAG: AAA family ATPase [Deltaproteobacteria bacterium]|nr:AAA family ATPase [Deltaproteobacteria bacterium]
MEPMYEAYWALALPPFDNVPDPRFFYPSASHGECLARLSFATERRKGAALIVGSVGCGKTILSRQFLSSCPAGSHDVAVLVNPNLTAVEFLQELLRQWGEEPRSSDKSSLLAQIRERIMKNFQRRVETLVVVDEAQAIRSEETLEEIRLLLNYQIDDRFLLTVLLLGQPEVAASVRALPQLDQRIAVRGRLEALDHADTVKYVLTRLKQAGAVRCMFTPQAVAQIYALSHGIPREINNLCDASLLQAYLDKAEAVDVQHVVRMTEELRWCA